MYQMRVRPLEYRQRHKCSHMLTRHYQLLLVKGRPDSRQLVKANQSSKVYADLEYPAQSL